jgi:hypothetical protein
MRSVSFAYVLSSVILATNFAFAADGQGHQLSSDGSTSLGPAASKMVFAQSTDQIAAPKAYSPNLNKSNAATKPPGPVALQRSDHNLRHGSKVNGSTYVDPTDYSAFHIPKGGIPINPTLPCPDGSMPDSIGRCR